jgi:hypothetical protein
MQTITQNETVTIVIETGNDAFTDAPASEIARILRAIASRLESTGFPPHPRDDNGNRCGSTTVE